MYFGRIVLLGVFACWSARVLPVGQRLSSVCTRKARRLADGVATHAWYAPELSAMPMYFIGTECQPPVTYICPASNCALQPVLPLICTTRSEVIPVVASAITSGQFTAARSAGVRAIAARARAR